MNKIFKYTITDGKILAPKDIKIIRCDHVDDGFYKGDFAWGIVDANDKEMVEREVIFPFSLNKKPKSFDGLNRIQLSVKEKQTIIINGKPLYAEDDDGKMFVYYEKSNPLDGAWESEYEIVVYKTGQEITEPLDELVYLGLNKLWIMQELGLYTFIRYRQ